MLLLRDKLKKSQPDNVTHASDIKKKTSAKHQVVVCNKPQLDSLCNGAPRFLVCYVFSGSDRSTVLLRVHLDESRRTHHEVGAQVNAYRKEHVWDAAGTAVIEWPHV